MQEGKYYKTVSINDILKQYGQTDLLPIAIHKSLSKNLKTNLIVAPQYQAFSLAIEYMSKWFYSKFDKNFFHHKFLDASHILDQFRTLRTRDLIVVNKPSAHIAVDEDSNFNRNNIDLYNLGATLYTNRGSIQDSFFKDREKNVYITFVPRQIKLTFSFSIRLATKAQQDDVASICEMVFRAGGSQKHYIDADFPVPKELIGQLACDLGFCNEDNKYDVYQMLHYLNQRSRFAFLYKFNTATSTMDYYIRIPHFLVHIITSQIQKDRMIMKNMSATDHIIRFSCDVRFPALKFFAYYSMIERQSISSITRLDKRSFLFGITNLCNIPPKNDKGWQWDFRSDYTLDTKEELYRFEHKLPISIELSNIGGELLDTILYTKNLALNPSVFMEIKAFNYLRYIPSDIDWCNMRLNLLEPLESKEIYLFFYIDKEYLHNSMRILKRYDEYRMRYSDDRIGPELELGTKLPDIGEKNTH